MMKLHIEGKDAARLMNMIDGMGTLRITNNDSKIVDVASRPVIGRRFYHGSGKLLTAQYIAETDLDPRCFYVRDEVVEWTYPEHYSLYCQMKAAMRGMGWSGQDNGNNSISVQDFLNILWQHAQENGLDIRYIETA